MENKENKKITLEKISKNFLTWDKLQQGLIDLSKELEATLLTGYYHNEIYNKNGRLPFCNYLDILEQISQKINSNGAIGSKIKNIDINTISDIEIDNLISELKNSKRGVLDSFVNIYKDPKNFEMFTYLENEFNSFNWLTMKHIIQDFLNIEESKDITLEDFINLVEFQFNFDDKTKKWIHKRKVILEQKKYRSNWSLEDYIKESRKIAKFIGKFIQISITKKIQLLTILKFYNKNEFNEKTIYWIKNFDTTSIEKIYKEDLVSWIYDWIKIIKEKAAYYGDTLKPQKYLSEYFNNIEISLPEFYNSNKKNFVKVLQLLKKLKQYYEGSDINSSNLHDRGLYFIVQWALKTLKTININKKMNLKNFNNLKSEMEKIINDFDEIFLILNKWIQDFRDLQKNLWFILKNILKMEKTISEKKESESISKLIFESRGPYVITDMMKDMNKNGFMNSIEEEVIDKDYFLINIENYLSNIFDDSRLLLLKSVSLMDLYILRISIENFDNITLEDIKLDKLDDSFDFELYDDDDDDDDDDHDCCDYHECGINLL